VREIIPNVEAYWMETYGRVALEGTAAHIENYSASLKRWYEVFAYRTAPRQFAVFFTDITERKKNEEELRRLSQFPEENPNPVLRCAPDGEILFANASARNWLAMLGWQTGDVLPSPVRTAVVEARGKDHAIETEITCRAGRTFSIFSLQPEDEDYINLYGLDITKRKLAEEALRAGEERLRASLGEKEVLLKEIHHRVKNNMQVISSLIALQADEVHDAAMHAVLLEVTHRVRSMAMVHEKLYQSADLARVEFADYAQSLLNYLWRAHRTEAFGVGLTLDLEPVTLPVNAAVPCGLILNELIGNALKHAFRDGSGDGEVNVSLKNDGQGRVSLCVRDNGIGLPAGLDWRQAQSLGLRLVQMLAVQLGATVECSSNRGTQFRVTFTVKETDV
jgi:two-component sensor histidine kinase